mgnify:CR=1 FL=1
MKGFPAATLLIFVGLFARPLVSVEPVVRYYLPESPLIMGKVQYIDYGTLEQRHYIRTEQNGRFLKPEESVRLLDPGYVERIRQGNRWQAAGESLLFFDRGAEYVHFSEPGRAQRVNWRSRLLKLSSLAATGIAYWNLRSKASEYSRSIRYVNHSVPEARYNRASSYYNLTLIITASIWGYETYRAYADFGTSPEIGDLQIPERTEVDPATFFESMGNADGMIYLSYQWSF